MSTPRSRLWGVRSEFARSINTAQSYARTVIYSDRDCLWFQNLSVVQLKITPRLRTKLLVILTWEKVRNIKISHWITFSLRGVGPFTYSEQYQRYIAYKNNTKPISN